MINAGRHHFNSGNNPIMGSTYYTDLSAQMLHLRKFVHNNVLEAMQVCLAYVVQQQGKEQHINNSHANPNNPQTTLGGFIAIVLQEQACQASKNYDSYSDDLNELKCSKAIRVPKHLVKQLKNKYTKHHQYLQITTEWLAVHKR